MFRARQLLAMPQTEKVKKHLIITQAFISMYATATDQHGPVVDTILAEIGEVIND